MVTHGNVARLLSATAEWFHFNERDVWTLFHSLAFDFSVWEIWGCLLHGGRLVIVPFTVSRSPEDFHELLAKEQVTVLNQTPSAFYQLMTVDQARRSPELALRLVIFGGEALNFKTLQPWFETHDDRHPLLINMYGITETTVHVTYREVTASRCRRGRAQSDWRPDSGYATLPAWRRQAACAGRRSGRDLCGWSGRGARILEPSRTQRRAICARSVFRDSGCADVPIRRSGPSAAGRRSGISWPRRRSGKDSRISHRTRRDRSRDRWARADTRGASGSPYR